MNRGELVSQKRRLDWQQGDLAPCLRSLTQRGGDGERAGDFPMLRHIIPYVFWSRVKAESAPQSHVLHFSGTALITIRLLGFANLLWESFTAAFAETVSEHVCYTRC